VTLTNKTQRTKGKECYCGPLQTSALLQLLFFNFGTTADEHLASALVTLPPLSIRQEDWLAPEPCENGGEQKNLHPNQKLNPELFTIQPTAQ
jgi:hypothetical protein